jgi:hypothetical protein
MDKDAHLVAHDAVILATAAVSAVGVELATDSAAASGLAAATTLAVGAAVMYTKPVRRAVNRAINAVDRSTK